MGISLVASSGCVHFRGLSVPALPIRRWLFQRSSYQKEKSFDDRGDGRQGGISKLWDNFRGNATGDNFLLAKGEWAGYNRQLFRANARWILANSVTSCFVAEFARIRANARWILANSATSTHAEFWTQGAPSV